MRRGGDGGDGRLDRGGRGGLGSQTPRDIDEHFPARLFFSPSFEGAGGGRGGGGRRRGAEAGRSNTCRQEDVNKRSSR